MKFLFSPSTIDREIKIGFRGILYRAWVEIRLVLEFRVYMELHFVLFYYNLFENGNKIY